MARWGQTVHQQGPGPRRAQGLVSPKQINSIIIKAADSQRADYLATTVDNYLPSMNIVNLSTSLCRFAKLFASQPKARYVAEPTVARLVSAVWAFIGSSELEECYTQAISNIVWSLASMQRPEQELPMLASLAVAKMSRFKFIELSSLLWAFAKLGSHAFMPRATSELFAVAANRVEGEAGEMELRCLSTISWAYATAKQTHPSLFAILAAAIRRKAHLAKSQEIANVVWAFGTAGHRDIALFEALGDMAVGQLRTFKAQEISSTLWGFAKVYFFHAAFYQLSIETAIRMQLNSQQLANMLWACARVRPRHPMTRCTVTQMLPRCTELLNTFKPQEGASVLLAVSKVFGHVGQHHPQEVLDFRHAAEIWAMPRAQSFSVQSLTTSIMAFAALGSENPGLWPALEGEVSRRAWRMSEAGLIIMFRSLVVHVMLPTEIISVVAASLAWKFPLHDGDLRELGKIYATHVLGVCENTHVPSEELLSWCQSLAVGEATTGPRVRRADHEDDVGLHEASKEASSATRHPSDAEWGPPETVLKSSRHPSDAERGPPETVLKSSRQHCDGPSYPSETTWTSTRPSTRSGFMSGSSGGNATSYHSSQPLAPNMSHAVKNTFVECYDSELAAARSCASNAFRSTPAWLSSTHWEEGSGHKDSMSSSLSTSTSPNEPVEVELPEVRSLEEYVAGVRSTFVDVPDLDTMTLRMKAKLFSSAPPGLESSSDQAPSSSSGVAVEDTSGSGGCLSPANQEAKQHQTERTCTRPAPPNLGMSCSQRERLRILWLSRDDSQEAEAASEKSGDDSSESKSASRSHSLQQSRPEEFRNAELNFAEVCLDE
jgi:hypothetical protein